MSTLITPSSRRQFLTLLGLSAVAVSCGSGGGGAAKDQTKTLRYQGWAGSVTLPELAEDLGYLEDVKLKWVGNTISGPQDIQSAATGETDFGGAFNGAVVKLAAAQGPDQGGDQLLRRPTQDATTASTCSTDSPISSARDLIGKKVGDEHARRAPEAMLESYLAAQRADAGRRSSRSSWSSCRRSTPSRRCARGRSTWPSSAASCATRPWSAAASARCSRDYELFGAFTAGTYVLTRRLHQARTRTPSRTSSRASRKAIEWAQRHPARGGHRPVRPRSSPSASRNEDADAAQVLEELRRRRRRAA